MLCGDGTASGSSGSEGRVGPLSMPSPPALRGRREVGTCTAGGLAVP